MLSYLRTGVIFLHKFGKWKIQICVREEIRKFNDECPNLETVE